MALGMRAKSIVAVAAVLILAVLVYAWVDGGREPLREIVLPIDTPEIAR